MTQKSKVAWLESQYLYPHHFQQQERYIESSIQERCDPIRPYVWGFQNLEIDSAQLADGHFGLVVARGIMPDGTPFNMPSDAHLPRSVMVPEDTKDALVYLVLPRYQAGSRHLDMDDEGESIARYRLHSAEVFDYSSDSADAVTVETASLHCRLALEHEDLGGYTSLPVARIREVTPEGSIILDKLHISPSLAVSNSKLLNSYIKDVIGLLQQRGEALAVRFIESNQASGSSAIADFMLLQMINRYEPRFRHMAKITHLHPEKLYLELLGLMGELSTFTTNGKRPLEIPSYDHSDLFSCYQPLMDNLSRHLSAVLEQTAISLPVEDRQYGIRVARISDRSLLAQSRFILAAKADVSTDLIRDQLPSHTKISAVEMIRDLVNNQLPGVAMESLPVAPREIPYHAGCVYFELDKKSDHWQHLKNAGGFAFHVAGEFPGLELEFWAVRQ